MKTGAEKIISRVLFRATVALDAVMIIHLGRRLPCASSDTTREHQTGRLQTFPYLVLLRMGFALPFPSPEKR